MNKIDITRVALSIAYLLSWLPIVGLVLGGVGGEVPQWAVQGNLAIGAVLIVSTLAAIILKIKEIGEKS